MRKKVLLTNYAIRNYTGSEIDTITIANYFLKEKYDVTIFTLYKGAPLLLDVNDKIKVISIEETDKLEEKYDILWGHHYPLVDYVIFGKRIDFDYVAYLSLSHFVAYEYFPIYYKDLSYVSVLNKAGYEEWKNFGYDMSNVDIFPNYSFNDYFQNKKRLNENINNIAIISNHIVPELIELKNECEKNNINIDIYGKGYTYAKVDDKLLLNYDVIISIGKTVNYSISLGIPTYVYDHFGGDGYITSKNIEKSFDNNFSGRYLRKKMNGKEIFEDITNNYKNTVKEINNTFQFALDNFCLENNIKKVIEKIYSKDKIDMKIIREKYRFYAKTAGLFVDAICQQREYWIEEFNSFNKYQVYYDYGEGYNEKQSFISIYKNEKEDYSTKIIIPRKCEKIRFDFANRKNIIIEDIKINDEKNRFNNLRNCIILEDKIITINEDPSFEIDCKNIDEITINMRIKNIDNSIYSSIYKKNKKNISFSLFYIIIIIILLFIILMLLII